MDGSVWSIIQQSDMCLASYSVSVAFFLSMMRRKLKLGLIPMRQQCTFFKRMAWLNYSYSFLTGFSHSVAVQYLRPMMPAMAPALKTFFNLEFCSTCKSLSLSFQLYTTGMHSPTENQQSATVHVGLAAFSDITYSYGYFMNEDLSC